MAAGGAREAFEKAAALIQKDAAAAEAMFEEVAARWPEDDWAADALLEAAELSEERLGRPDRARELYQRLLEQYPNSRLALRARARRDFLAANLRGGVEPLAEYQDILLHYGTRPRAESVARMERLLKEHPGFPLADKAALWLAGNAAQAGEWADAERRYRAIEERWPGSAAASEAMRGRAEVLLVQGRALEARRIYSELAGRGDAIAIDVARRGVRAANRALWRFAFYLAALAYLIGFVIVRIWQARGALRRMPIELKFYLPVAALLALAGAGATSSVLAALCAIAIGGAVVIWAAGVAAARRLERGPMPPGARARAVAATALAVVCLGYAALHTTNTLDFFIETMRSGAER